MIAYISGKILSKQDGSFIVLVGGIGYEIFSPNRIISSYAREDSITLHIFHRLKEDSSLLFGFEKKSEKALFQTILSVSGVGPKTAIALMNFSPDEICNAIETEDIAMLTKVPGLGKKTASRLILEIKGKLPSLTSLSDTVSTSGAYQDIISALEGLGFLKVNISSVLEKIPEEVSIQEDENIIKWALKELSSS